MNKRLKIGLGVLVLVLACGVSFFAGNVSARHEMRHHHRHMPPYCCAHHHHHHGYHHGHHRRMCSPEFRNFSGKCPAATLGDARSESHHPRTPKVHNKNGLHIKSDAWHTESRN